jgi:acyl-CoA dehydrogenase
MASMSDQRAMLADTVGRVLRDAAQVQSAVSEGWNTELARGVEELGLPLLLVAADSGGFGGCWQDAFVVQHAVGIHAIALPIGETMLAVHLLAAAGLEVPAGLIGLAARAEGRLARGAEGGASFTGQAFDVPWGTNVDNVVAVIDHDDERSVLLLPRSVATSVSEKHNLAAEPRATLHFENARVRAVLCRCPAARHLYDHCALLRIGQIAGALESVLARTIQYAKERVQFGKPIASFQAVQQQLAQLGCEAAAAGCAARAAFRAADHGDATFEIAAAKLRANAAIDVGTGIAHQVHGAIGFTREHDLRHFTQRLWSWRSEFGNDRYWSERLGAQVAARGAKTFWADLTARGDEMAAAEAST